MKKKVIFGENFMLTKRSRDTENYTWHPKSKWQHVKGWPNCTERLVRNNWSNDDVIMSYIDLLKNNTNCFKFWTARYDEVLEIWNVLETTVPLDTTFQSCSVNNRLLCLDYYPSTIIPLKHSTFGTTLSLVILNTATIISKRYGDSKQSMNTVR